MGLAIVGMAAMATMASCSSSGGDDGTASTTTRETTADAPADAPADVPAGTNPIDPWAVDAQEHRGQDGETVDYECPPRGAPDTVWGIELYTDDSSVCTAAVQVGLITFDEGGDVTIEIAPGEPAYSGGAAGGVTSLAYGEWPGSFLFPSVPRGSIKKDASEVSWADSPKSLGGADGATVTVVCPSGGTAGSLWGTGPHTTDSSVCTAAVFAGVISFERGGEVTFTIGAGLDSYPGATAHGVTASAWGPYDASFTIETSKATPTSSPHSKP